MSRCSHEPKVTAACSHLPGAAEYCERFSGRGLHHELVCPACAEAAAPVSLCAACAAAAISDAAWNADRGVIGTPAAASRDDGLTFVHERVELGRRLPAAILDLQPAPGPGPVFYAFLADGGLHRLDLAARTVDQVADLSARHLHMARAVALAVSPAGDAAAVVNDEGGTGTVVALADGRETLALHRSDFKVGNRFPLALTSHGGRTLVLHATRWNRIDVSDALTGEVLSARSYGMVAEGERPPHYLDFSYAHLAVAPGGDRVAATGESEDGLGRVATFRLGRALEDDPWESEDGASRLEHCPRWYAPDPPIAWLDDRHLAVWGHGPSARCLIDAVEVCDAERGGSTRWFPGPQRGELVAAGPHLLVCSASGTSVWDAGRGQRLLHDPGFTPQRFHAGCSTLVTTGASGELFVLSRLERAG